MFYVMVHPAIQMAGPIGQDKKSLDISYCDLLILGRELKDAPGYSLSRMSDPFRETRSRSMKRPGLLHS
jgi:hypothetical protein